MNLHQEKSGEGRDTLPPIPSHSIVAPILAGASGAGSDDLHAEQASSQCDHQLHGSDPATTAPAVGEVRP